MKHYQIHFQPDNLTTRIHQGATLLEAAGQVGIILSNPCGGTGRCFKCRVDLAPSGKSVLACQYTINSDLTVTIPETSRFFSQQILEHGIRREVLSEPSVKKVFFQTFEPDINQLREALSKSINAAVYIENSLEEELLCQLRKGDSGFTAILGDWINPQAEISESCYLLSGIEANNTSKKLYGLAIDIGTTSVVARLVDLNSAKVICIQSSGNPQIQYGADVISRISYSQQPDGPEQLQGSIISCLNQLIEQTASKGHIDRNDIYDIVIVGNTTMNHLLLKLPVTQLGQAPYQAHSLSASSIRPKDLGLNINSTGYVHVLANIAGFVGSDTVAAAMACGLDLSTVNTLLVDIGTNGEIILGSQSHLLAASCAAGPALEGAGILFGSRAQSGAIERVLYDGNEIDVDVIGSEKAQTLCGSGLIDAVAVMLQLEIIDTTGRFYEACQLNPMLGDSVHKRLIRTQDEPAFVIAGQYVNNHWENAVYLTQGDIRELQLAKAAIRAGIEMLLKKAQIPASDVQTLFLAGAFGNYIQKENAVRIGLLPDIPVNNIHFVGNAAGSGAEMALLNRESRILANNLARKIDYLEIAHAHDFQMVFSEYLLFPEK